jgi:hypothetical protein
VYVEGKLAIKNLSKLAFTTHFGNVALVGFENIIFLNNHFAAAFADETESILLVFELWLVVIIED